MLFWAVISCQKNNQSFSFKSSLKKRQYLGLLSHKLWFEGQKPDGWWNFPKWCRGNRVPADEPKIKQRLLMRKTIQWQSAPNHDLRQVRMLLSFANTFLFYLARHYSYAAWYVRWMQYEWLRHRSVAFPIGSTRIWFALDPLPPARSLITPLLIGHKLPKLPVTLARAIFALVWQRAENPISLRLLLAESISARLWRSTQCHIRFLSLSLHSLIKKSGH